MAEQPGRTAQLRAALRRVLETLGPPNAPTLTDAEIEELLEDDDSLKDLAHTIEEWVAQQQASR